MERSSSQVAVTPATVSHSQQAQAGASIVNSNVGTSQQENYQQIGNDNQLFSAATINFYEARKSFSDVADWLSQADPFKEHRTARQQHQPETCSWLLEHPYYRQWRGAASGHLWMYGQPGCGKTVLCSTVIEDLKAHCSRHTDTELAVFYFTFSDNHKQSYNDLITSLVAQLGWKEPASSQLRQAFEKSRIPSTDELEDILLNVAHGYRSLYIALDALDECPKEGRHRQIVMERLLSLAKRSSMLKIFMTSRDLPELRHYIEDMPAAQLSIPETTVDEDIRTYLTAKLATDPTLRRLTTDAKTAIKDGITERSRGMFRYADLQLQEIHKRGSRRPSKLQKALDRLPKSLDETYLRILHSIHEDDKDDAITLLRWIAYAERPLTLRELVEVVTIDYEAKTVLMDDRGELEDALRILSGLAIVIDPVDGASDASSCSSTASSSVGESSTGLSEDDFTHIEPRHYRMLTATVRLAHFSVKEFLESTRVASHAAPYQLDVSTGHFRLMKACLVYLRSYSSSAAKTHTDSDLTTFGLLAYTARHWWQHARQHGNASVAEEITFLMDTVSIRDCLSVHDTYKPHFEQFDNIDIADEGLPLLLASFHGLHDVAKGLIAQGIDVNARAKHYDGKTALVAAVQQRDLEMTRLLLSAGADANIGDRYHVLALHNAACSELVPIAQLLLAAGADVNARDDDGETALYKACLSITDNEPIRLLLRHGADTSLSDCRGDTVLHRAAMWLDATAVEILLDHGAGPSTRNKYGVSPLHHAVYKCDTFKTNLLLDAGADINAQDSDGKSVLMVAVLECSEDLVRLLLARGALVNVARGGDTAVTLGLKRCTIEIVAMLLDYGATIDLSTAVCFDALLGVVQSGHIRMLALVFERCRPIDQALLQKMLNRGCSWNRIDMVQTILQEHDDLDTSQARERAWRLKEPRQRSVHAILDSYDTAKGELRHGS